jgi:pseudomonalisin
MKLRHAALTSVVALSAAAVAIAPTALGGPADASSGPALSRTLNVVRGLASATDLGALPAAQRLELAVSVSRPDPSGETAYLRQVEDPSGPLFRHFLTPAQFAARFGVPAATRQAVRSWLTGGGLEIAGVSAAGDLYDVSGTVAQIDSLLHLTLERYSASGARFWANAVAPSVPASLPIANIAGLNSLQRFSTPAQDTCVGGTCLGTTTPQDLRTAYDAGGLTGTGQGVAMFGEGDSAGPIADLRRFESENGLPQLPVSVEHPAGDTDFSDTSGAEEWDIDTQASTGMAPDATGLTMYFGSDLSDQDVEKVFSTYVNDADGPQQASASYGECEQLPAGLTVPGLDIAGLGLAGSSSDDAELSAIEQQGALEGRSIFVSTGDTGSSCPVVQAPVLGAGNGVLNQGVPITNSPASLPYSVAVGGTVLYTDGTGHRTREYGWAFGGGGDTLLQPQPAYQAGDTGDSLPCLTGGACRGIPDIAAQSGDAVTNGYGIVSDGADTQGGGTSLSAPLAQGLWADIQSSAPSASGYGFANYVYYAAGESADYARTFFDVSSTDTSTSLPSTNGLYPSMPGWDYQTGWGTQDVQGLAAYAADMS